MTSRTDIYGEPFKRYTYIGPRDILSECPSRDRGPSHPCRNGHCQGRVNDECPYRGTGGSAFIQPGTPRDKFMQYFEVEEEPILECPCPAFESFIMDSAYLDLKQKYVRLSRSVGGDDV